MTLVRADTGQDDRAGRGYSAQAAAAGRPVLGLTVSVVICACALDRWDDLKQAVISVGSQAADEIVLVIDHCAELLTQAGLLAQLLPWNIVVAPNRFGPGLAGARNTGMAVAQGDIVAFLDDRAVAGPGWLAALAGHYQDPRVLGVGGMVRPEWPDGRCISASSRSACMRACSASLTAPSSSGSRIETTSGISIRGGICDPTSSTVR